MKDKTTEKKRTGRPPKHGAYSLLVKAGELPQRLGYIRRFIEEARAGLIRDVGGTAEGLTTAQAVLIDRAISLLGVIRTIESNLAEEGIMQGGNLVHVLRDSYLAYTNSLRLILRELGINTRKGDEPLDLGRYIELKDREKAEESPGTPVPGKGDPK